MLSDDGRGVVRKKPQDEQATIVKSSWLTM